MLAIFTAVLGNPYALWSWAIAPGDSRSAAAMAAGLVLTGVFARAARPRRSRA